jgi:hypothetical protein
MLRLAQQDVICEQLFGLKLDNGLLIIGASVGEPVDQSKVISLAAMVEALYVSATLESRTLGRIDACYQL